MNTPDIVSRLGKNEVFVFGSNTAGRHGKGAAKTAMILFGADYGVGEGMTGPCYAIPTKDSSLKTRRIELIKESVRQFLFFAHKNPMLRFLVTKIGCGLAGMEPRIIGPMFKGAPGNVILPIEFEEEINKATEQQ